MICWSFLPCTRLFIHKTNCLKVYLDSDWEFSFFHSVLWLFVVLPWIFFWVWKGKSRLRDCTPCTYPHTTIGPILMSDEWKVIDWTRTRTIPILLQSIISLDIFFSFLLPFSIHNLEWSSYSNTAKRGGRGVGRSILIFHLLDQQQNLRCYTPPPSH